MMRRERVNEKWREMRVIYPVAVVDVERMRLLFFAQAG